MLEESFMRTIQEHKLFMPGDRVLAAISGGPDSLAMTHRLKRLSGELGITLFACHVNHMLRGAEADEDAEFTRRFCQELRIPIAVRTLDVPALKQKTGLGTQEAARLGRLEILVEEARACGANKIAIAQNLDDQAETVLMRLLRGTGPSGIGGIWPKRRHDDSLSFVRPLLGTTRAEIMDYIARNGLAFRTDPSNMKPVYTRNRIRLELIPALREYNPNVMETLARLAELAQEESEFLSELAAPLLDSILVKNSSAELDLKVLAGLSRAGKRYVVRRAIECAFGDLRRVELQHIDCILKMLESGARQVELPGGRARTARGRLIIERPQERLLLAETAQLQVPGETELPSIGRLICARVTGVESLSNSPSENTDDSRAYLDYDAVVMPVTVRKRKNGDSFSPLGMAGQKKVKDFLIAAGVPLAHRDGVPVLTDATGAIMWLAGLRIDERFKVTGTTRRVLELEVKEPV